MGMYDSIKLVFRQSYNAVHEYFVILRIGLQSKAADASLSSVSELWEWKYSLHSVRQSEYR